MKKTLIISALIISCLFIPKQEKVTQAEIKALAVATFKSEQMRTDANAEQISSRSSEETRIENIEPQIVIATDISQECIDFIKEKEGFRDTAYRQNKNEEYLTIGYRSLWIRCKSWTNYN